jgi:hypothetical protein
MSSEAAPCSSCSLHLVITYAIWACVSTLYDICTMTHSSNSTVLNCLPIIEPYVMATHEIRNSLLLPMQSLKIYQGCV